MSLEVEMFAPGLILTDITDRVRLAGLNDEGIGLTYQAEEGGVGNSRIIIDDPAGDLYIVGGHGIRVRETLSESDDPYLFQGAFGARRVVRGPYRTGVSRQWHCDVIDGNSALSRQIFRPTEDAKRPAETCGERGAWLLSTVQMAELTDHRYWDTTDDTPLDEADYTRSNALQVIQDMINQSGYDAGVIYAGDTEQYAPFYMAPDSDLLDSDLRLSNIIADVRGDETGNTAYIDEVAELVIDDDRVASGILGEGDGIEVFSQRQTTAVTFARRDKVMTAPHVKSLPVLRARVQRWLSDFDSEEVTATCKVLLPPEKVTMLKAQYRVQVRATHWPGVTDWTWCRVLSATPEQITTAGYLVAVELAIPHVPVDTADCALGATPSGTYEPMNSMLTPVGGIAYYYRAGLPVPVIGDSFTGNWHFAEPGTGGDPDIAGYLTGNTLIIGVRGAGDLTVHTVVTGGSVNVGWSAATRAEWLWGTVPGAGQYDSGVIAAGDDLEISFDTEGGEFCEHFVALSFHGAEGVKVGYAGAEWVSTEV